MSINSVDALRSSVKMTIEAASDRVIITGLLILFSVKLPPIITGSSGNTHGARIVKIPARKAIGKYSIAMSIYFISATTSPMVNPPIQDLIFSPSGFTCTKVC